MDAVEVPVENSMSPGKRVRIIAWAVAAGLVLGAILATITVGLRPPATGIADLDVIYLEGRGGPGVPFVIELELAEGGYPVVLLVDAEGLPSMLFPFAQPIRLAAGQRVRLPDPHGAATWWVESGRDAGTLMVAVDRNGPPATDRLLELAERAAARARDARSAREQVRQVMRTRLGPAVVTALGEAPRPRG